MNTTAPIEEFSEDQSNLGWKALAVSLEDIENSDMARPRAPNSTKARSEPKLLMGGVLQRSRTARSSPKGSTKMTFSASQVKCSLKENGTVKGYAASTDQGLVRDYNEDRVSIILNINKPPERASEVWPRSSFFGVYDGHGGPACADFLRDNLHQFVTRNSNFPFNPKEALIQGFAQAESLFLEHCRAQSPRDKSGSCAVVALIVGDVCYIANLGDSRAIMSGEGGTKVYPLTKDHKPNDPNERQRIERSGGRIYQSTAQISPDQQILGPFRILPGRLSVSRSFGDFEAKIVEYGGNPEVLISTPDIRAFKIHSDYEFILMASDGIFDKLSNREVVQCVLAGIHQKIATDVHRMCAAGVETVMVTALNKKTMDNITVLIIGLEGLLNRAKT
jgi:protein phosphatase PTC2/3